MAPTYTLAGPGIENSQVKIGQLVTDIWNPISSFYSPPYDGQLVQPIITTRYHSTIQYKTDSEASVFLKLSKFFGIGSERDSSVSLEIEAHQTGEQMLPNYADAFRQLYCDPSILSLKILNEARTWIQNRMLEEKPIYMVIGVKTVRDAKVAVEKANGSMAALKFGVPVSEMVSGGVSTLMTATDLMIAAAVAQSKEAREAHTLKGEWVIAVAYTKLKLSSGRRGSNQYVPGSLRWEWYCGYMRLAVDPKIGRDPADEIDVEAKLEDIDPKELEEEEDDEEDGEDKGEPVTSVELDGVNFFF